MNHVVNRSKHMENNFSISPSLLSRNLVYWCCELLSKLWYIINCFSGFVTSFRRVFMFNTGNLTIILDDQSIKMKDPHSNDASENRTNNWYPKIIIICTKHIIPTINKCSKKAWTKITSLKRRRKNRNSVSWRSIDIQSTYRIKCSCCIEWICTIEAHHDQNKRKRFGYIRNQTIEILQILTVRLISISIFSITCSTAIMKINRRPVLTIWSINAFQCGTPLPGIVKKTSAVPLTPVTWRIPPSKFSNWLK